MEVIPAVDVLDGHVVRLHQGRYDEVTRYGSDVVEQVSRFVEAGASRVHVVDLAAARSGVPSPGLWESLVGVEATIQAGGGVRTAEVAGQLIASTVSRVVVGTAAVRSDGTLEEIIHAVGPEALVVGLDVRDGRVRGSGWTDEGRPLDEVVGRIVAAGVVRVLVTGIATDGTKKGPDTDLLTRVRNLAPDLAIIASGGVGNLEHVRALAAAGHEAVIVGRAIYDGAFTLEDAIDAVGGA